MAGSIESGEDELIAGINVTPLVDVVLVLLIIFMITAPILYQSAIKVQLPRAKSGEESPRTPLNFTLTKEGKLLWDKDEVDYVAVTQRLAAMGAKVTDQTAIISADEASSYGPVMKLMDTLRQAGLTHFALNVEAPAAVRSR